MDPGPILGKIAEAAGYVQNGYENQQPHAISDDSILLMGKDESYCHVGYDQGTGGVILVFVGNTQWDVITKDRYSGREKPSWLPDEDVKCHGSLLQQFNSFLHPDDDQKEQLSLLEAIMFQSKGYIPRRVTCTGFSLGGALASLASCWAGITLATADTRCITFGAPRVGNSNFKAAAENLVGINYRIIYESDPSPHHPRPLLFSHSGHPIWLHDGEIEFQDPPKLQQRVAHHAFANYIDILTSLVGGIAKRTPHAHHGPADAAGAAQHAVGSAVDGAAAVAGAVKGALGALVPKRGSVSTSGLDSRCLDDFEVEDSASASVSKSILAGKIAQATLLAWRAYDDEPTFRKATGLTNARLISYDLEDTQVYVAWLDGGTAVFAFRGTESAKDAQTDADARHKDIDWMSERFPKVRGHMGFMRQFGSVTDASHPERHIGLVLEELSGKSEPTRVLCCGHSLGGALATLAAAWAAMEYPLADIRCITLGSPRVGNSRFVDSVKYLCGGMHRLVHGWDPVPTVPPPGIGFKHVKGRMWLHKNTCRLRKRPWYCSYGLLVGKVGDHFVDPYASHITTITGLEIVAEKLGLIRQEEGGKLEPVKAAQNDHDGDGVPSSAPVHSSGGATALAALTGGTPSTFAPDAPPKAAKETADKAWQAASAAQDAEGSGSVKAEGIDGEIDTVAEVMAAAGAHAQGAEVPQVKT